MKFCEKCGKELLEEAVLCPSCGCSTQTNVTIGYNKELDELEIKKRKEKIKRTYIIVSAIICVVLAVFLISIFVINSFKSKKITEEISGETFECDEDTSYSINRESYTFDDEGNCKHEWYYSSIYTDDPIELTSDWTYKIIFKKNSAYVLLSSDDKLKIKYDEEGEIIALYDSEDRKTFERE